MLLNFRHEELLYMCRQYTFYEQMYAVLVEALRYKPEGREFDSRWGHWNVSVT